MGKFKSGFHPFHVVDLSPWPLVMSLSVFSLVLNLYHFLNLSGSVVWMIESFFSSILVSALWWRDVIRESTFQGHHSEEVQKGLVLGVLLFICSEVMFFFSFFFGFLFSALCPDIEIGESWPPLGIEPLNFMMVPLMNTLILLSSGVSITWSHHSIMEGDWKNSLFGMVITVFLGFVFSFLQYEEYFSCSFTMADSVYGSFFFLMTGFHGIHVIVGVLFIMVSLFRILVGHFSKSHHFGFEAAAWYWHFVDVVWLFLFVTVYWWGS
uniref:Cytochrome c oxidase subunit 3 n=1 Tax=Campanulotes compar TaxID=135595 RepID=A0A386JN89_9NEOP|nr:cytochrome c oxidase subunit III [Campanulotes compar]AYD72938.1 cytochrome c oxidase subunit III [Campanulotes compar]